MVVYLAVFFGLTLGGRFYQPDARPNFVPFQMIQYDWLRGGQEFVINILGNLAAGFPMGVLLPSLPRRRCSWVKVAGAGFAVSLLIETLQWISGRRCADVDDLILNTLGGLMGYVCWLAADRVRDLCSRSRREA